MYISEFISILFILYMDPQEKLSTLISSLTDEEKISLCETELNGSISAYNVDPFNQQITKETLQVVRCMSPLPLDRDIIVPSLIAPNVFGEGQRYNAAMICKSPTSDVYLLSLSRDDSDVPIDMLVKYPGSYLVDKRAISEGVEEKNSHTQPLIGVTYLLTCYIKTDCVFYCDMLFDLDMWKVREQNSIRSYHDESI
jgi:hypothetical protein